MSKQNAFQTVLLFYFTLFYSVPAVFRSAVAKGKRYLIHLHTGYYGVKQCLIEIPQPDLLSAISQNMFWVNPPAGSRVTDPCERNMIRAVKVFWRTAF